jgi:hypothetical protein
VSEDPQAAESAEAAQSAVETEGSPPPWGDDFNPERAWQTITHLRDREKELEPDSKAYKRLQEDEDALREFLAERGFEVDDQEDPEPEADFDEEDDPTAHLQSRLDQFEQWKEQQEAEKQAERFSTDLKGFVGDRTLSQQGNDWIISQAHQGRIKAPKDLEKAVSDWFTFEEDQKKAAVDEYLKTKRAPNSPPQPGRAGEAEFDRKNATATERRNQRQARIAALTEAEQQ